MFHYNNKNNICLPITHWTIHSESEPGTPDGCYFYLQIGKVRVVNEKGEHLYYRDRQHFVIAIDHIVPCPRSMTPTAYCFPSRKIPTLCLHLGVKGSQMTNTSSPLSIKLAPSCVISTRDRRSSKGYLQVLAPNLDNDRTHGPPKQIRVKNIRTPRGNACQWSMEIDSSEQSAGFQVPERGSIWQ